jgi:hypothetical protein
MSSAQLAFGQSGAHGIGSGGTFVVTANPTFRFLISRAGIAWLPVTVIGLGSARSLIPAVVRAQ